MIRSVIFDFGRVISAQKPPSLFLRYELELGLDPGTINDVMFASDAWRDALLGRKSMMEFWMAIGPRLGLRTRRQIEHFHRRYYADERINAPVLACMKRLAGEYRLAVCSNSPPGLREWLEEWGLAELFDVVFCSGDEGIVKPDPAAYRITLERLGVNASEAIFVDDTWENVEAAFRVGLRVIHFTDGPALESALSTMLPAPL